MEPRLERGRPPKRRSKRRKTTSYWQQGGKLVTHFTRFTELKCKNRGQIRVKTLDRLKFDE